MVYTIWRFILFFDSERPRDEFFTGLYSYDYYDEGPMILHHGDEHLQFLIYIQDPEFDNDNNEYVEIKLHRKTNMVDENDY